MEYYFSNDFDFTITDVLLVHRFYYAKDVLFNGYVGGRKVNGIVYCISGKALYTFSDTKVVLKAGDLIFLPENAAYSVQCYDDIPFRHITTNFNMCSKDLRRLFPGKYDDLADQMVVAETPDIKELLERLLSVWENKKRGYRVLAKAIVSEILYKYLILLGKKYHTEDYAKIKPARDLLDEQYTKDISVSELATLCGFSETHFRRLFHKTFHCSPTEYRLNKRILLAKDLLLANELAVSEVAATVGFEDANYFSRIFKAHTGVTPSEYAKEVTPL